MWAAAAILAATVVSSAISAQQSNRNAQAQSAGQMAANEANRQEGESNRVWQGEQNRTAINENIATQYRQYDMNMAAQRDAQAFNAEQMSRSMAYDTEMSNTAYQRAMADMRAAGLNPMLAYQQGGASAPTVNPASSPMASVGAPSAPSGGGAQARIESTFAPRVSSAAQVAGAVTGALQAAANVQQTEQTTKNLEQQQRNLVAQEENIRVNTAKQAAEAVTEGVRPDQIRAATRSELGRPALIGAQAAQAGASARNQAEQAATEEDRRTLLREQAGEAIARANLGRQQHQANQTYGRVGATPWENVSQGIDAIRRSVW